ncbi:hypothetical protein LSAT2_032881 [Lamellibrachia satsuma]|nr:hypothetical protein LSAT2_032881 [Lamellibrachia satsuma]
MVTQKFVDSLQQQINLTRLQTEEEDKENAAGTSTTSETINDNVEKIQQWLDTYENENVLSPLYHLSSSSTASTQPLWSDFEGDYDGHHIVAADSAAITIVSSTNSQQQQQQRQRR